MGTSEGRCQHLALGLHSPGVSSEQPAALEDDAADTEARTCHVSRSSVLILQIEHDLFYLRTGITGDRFCATAGITPKEKLLGKRPPSRAPTLAAGWGLHPRQEVAATEFHHLTNRLAPRPFHRAGNGSQAQSHVAASVRVGVRTEPPWHHPPPASPPDSRAIPPTASHTGPFCPGRWSAGHRPPRRSAG